MVDWDQFQDQLVEQLENVPEVRELETTDEFNEMVNMLTIAIQDTIDIVVLLPKAVLHLHRW